jgi:5-hydroxyisourate hydrolase
MKVSLEILVPEKGWTQIAWGATDQDGRIRELSPGGQPLVARRCRLVFDTAGYFTSRGVEAFFPVVVVVFEIADPTEPYHVPLLISPHAFTTYRGS